MSKTFWAIIAAIIIVFAGIIIFNRDEANEPSSDAQPSNHTKGEGTTGVTFVEYADFECPYCAQFYSIVNQVVEEYQDRITFQFRHLPLPTHQHSRAAARAAEAAGKQGKFWEMHDLIFQNHAEWSGSNDATRNFEQYAEQLGLDIEKYKQDFASAEVNATINADIAAFEATGEQKSTPAFFLDGERIQATSAEEFSQLIDEAIAKKSGDEQSNEQPSDE